MTRNVTTTRTAYALAADAECGAPDSADSAGAIFLGSVADDLAERIDYAGGLADEDSTEDGTDLADMVHEVADAAPSIYTHRMWAEFTDLAAYNEDPTEFGAETSDMEQAARVCLYMIAERLCWVLIGEALEDDDESGDE